VTKEIEAQPVLLVIKVRKATRDLLAIKATRVTKAHQVIKETKATRDLLAIKVTRVTKAHQAHQVIKETKDP
jgi:hypothetical protein